MKSEGSLSVKPRSSVADRPVAAQPLVSSKVKSDESKAPPARKMPVLRSRPAFGVTGRDKMPRRSEPLRISKSASSTDLVKGSTNIIVVDRRGESGKPIEMVRWTLLRLFTGRRCRYLCPCPVRTPSQP